MKKIIIEEIKRTYSDESNCGYDSDNVVAALKFHDGVRSGWLTFKEVEGAPVICLTDKDVFTVLVSEAQDEGAWEYVNSHVIHTFVGLDFNEDFNTIFDSIYRDFDNPYVPLVRLLIAVGTFGKEDADRLISSSKGRYAHEIDIPASIYELNYLRTEEYDSNENQNEYVIS